MITIDLTEERNAWRRGRCVWVFRAGRTGELLDLFLSNKIIGIDWSIQKDLRLINSWEELRELVDESMDWVQTNQQSGQFAGMVWAFAYGMKPDDLIVTPIQSRRTILIGKVTGEYVFDPSHSKHLQHTRSIDWYEQQIPKENLDSELSIKVNTRRTLSRLLLEDGRERLMKLLKNSTDPDKVPDSVNNGEGTEPAATHDSPGENIEEFLKDKIAKSINTNYQSHELSRLIDEILKAKGFTTHLSPPGPDKGVDILASKGDLGFDKPTLCVQVKSGTTEVDRVTLDQLIGTMQNFSAENGLLVSWGGFKSSTKKEIPAQFFKVRLWDKNQIITEFLNTYENLSEEIKAEIPLKKVWILSEKEVI